MSEYCRVGWKTINPARVSDFVLLCRIRVFGGLHYWCTTGMASHRAHRIVVSVKVTNENMWDYFLNSERIKHKRCEYGLSRPRDGKKSYWRAPLPSLLSSASDRRSCRSALRWVHLWATISGRRKIHEHDPGIIIFLFLLQVQRFIQWVAVSHESRLLSSVSHAPHTDCLEIICQRYAND